MDKDVNIAIYTYSYTHIYTFIYLHIYIYMYICVHVSIVHMSSWASHWLTQSALGQAPSRVVGSDEGGTGTESTSHGLGEL